MKEMEMEEKKEWEGKEAKEDRKGKIDRGKRRKVKEMRQLSLGCRTRNKNMICIRTAGLYSPYLSWAFQPSTFFLKLLLVATVPWVFASTHQDHCVAYLGISLFFSWFSSLIINYHSSSQRQLVTFLPVASCLCPDIISEDVSSHLSTYQSNILILLLGLCPCLVTLGNSFALFPMTHILYVPDLWWWSITNHLGLRTKLLAGIILVRLFHSFRPHRIMYHLKASNLGSRSQTACICTPAITCAVPCFTVMMWGQWCYLTRGVRIMLMILDKHSVSTYIQLKTK